MSECAVVNYVGKIVAGTYKRAGRPSSAMSIEVSAQAQMVNSFGTNLPYLFGTRLDAGNEGKEVLLRMDCFNPQTLLVEPAKNFKAIDLNGWFVTPPSADNSSFAFVEKIDETDREWALSRGGHPLTDFVVVDKIAKPRTKKTPAKAGEPQIAESVAA